MCTPPPTLPTLPDVSGQRAGLFWRRRRRLLAQRGKTLSLYFHLACWLVPFSVSCFVATLERSRVLYTYCGERILFLSFGESYLLHMVPSEKCLSEKKHIWVEHIFNKTKGKPRSFYTFCTKVQ